MTSVEAVSSQPVLDRAAHGHRSTLLSQGVRLACKFISVLIVARWVSPADHGLFAMASTVLLVLALFRDAGLGTAALQARSLNAAQLNALFWVHLLLGAALAFVTLALAPLAADFYGAPAVAPLLRFTSGAFLLIGAGGFARSQLAREARFGEANFVENGAALAGTAALIAAALAGAGAYSFGWFLLISEAVATALAWRALRWAPQARPEWRAIRPLLRTGADVTAYQVLLHVLLQLDVIAVGRWFGTQAVGLYSRSAQLLAMPGLYVAAPLNQVTLVTLSRLGSDSAHFDRHSQTSTTVIAHFVLPLFAICIVLPAETVRLVLGTQWPDAAPLLRMLAIGSAATVITSLAYAMNVAAGRTHRLVTAAAAALPFTAAAVWFGRVHGPVGIATGIAAVNLLMALPRLWWVLRDLPDGFDAFCRSLVGPLVAMAACALGLWLTAALVPTGAALPRFIAAALGGAAGLAVAGLAWPRLRREWRILLAYLPLPAALTGRIG